MKKQKILFIDRDGTIIREPEDKQIDSLEKLEFLPNVLRLLHELQNEFRLVMVSNQDGLGTDSYPKEDFEIPHQKMMRFIENEGIHFDTVLICPHFSEDQCDCRKPSPKMVIEYLYQKNIALDKTNSFVLGDRDSDKQLAENLSIGFIQLDQEDPKSWIEARKTLKQNRRANLKRTSKETDIEISVDLDGTGQYEISTGIPFFDHMLEQLARHGSLDLKLNCKGDLEVDSHHSIEDVAIALGDAILEALGNKFGINRYSVTLPMDESRCQVDLDLSGRFHFQWKAEFGRENIGGLDSEMVKHFFHSLAEHLRASVHIQVEGDNDHHKIEILFKTFAVSLKSALQRGGQGLPTTKGFL